MNLDGGVIEEDDQVGEVGKVFEIVQTRMNSPILKEENQGMLGVLMEGEGLSCILELV